jgi:RecA-family ATPase
MNRPRQGHQFGRAARAAGARDGSDSQSPPPPLQGESFYDLINVVIDPKTNLLGNRLLTQDGSMLLVAPSGIGKSCLSIHGTAHWAIGREYFGIVPARPLKILFVQSEDDRADMKKFMQAVRKMKLTPEERELLKANTRHQYCRNLTGDAFIDALDSWLTAWPADIVVINPLTGFYVEDLTNTAALGHFLRNQINGLMEKHHCAPIIVHHPTKSSVQNPNKNLEFYAEMYVGAGAAVLTQWARAIVSIKTTRSPRVFKLIIAKRYQEVGWPDGEREKFIAHSNEVYITKKGSKHDLIEWVEATAEQVRRATQSATKRKDRPTLAQVLKAMPEGEKYIKAGFVHWMAEEFEQGLNFCEDVLKELVAGEYVQISKEKRSGTRDLHFYSKAPGALEKALAAEKGLKSAVGDYPPFL